ncbi:MAG: dihydropteroate synthase [Actinomycetota bacterium]
MSVSDLGLVQNRTLVMGILNVTPDSFSDGGLYASTSSAIERGLVMVEEGADIIDVGGESTRPNSERISLEEEADRVLPVVEALAKSGAIVSIDTTRAEIAKASFGVGAKIVNDISAGKYDSEMLSTVAKLNCPYIAMHTRGTSKTMNSMAVYSDVVKEVLVELSERVDAALGAGISSLNIVLDPGIGFAKESEHNWELLKHLSDLEKLNFPVLVGASRKRFLGALTGTTHTAERESASVALTTLLAQRRTWGVRVHTVKPHVDAIKVVEMMR